MEIKEQAEARAALLAYKELVESKGWKRLTEIANAQKFIREQDIFLKPLKSHDETLEQEYKKGELSGIALFLNIPEIEIKKFTELLNRQEKENATSDKQEPESGE